MNTLKISRALFLSSALLGASGAATAASGPHCIAWEGTCWVLKFEVNDERLTYGREIGCDPEGVVHSAVGGGHGAGFASQNLGYDYADDTRAYEVKSDGTITIYQNSGTGLTFFNSGTWSHVSCAGSVGASSAGGGNPND